MRIPPLAVLIAIAVLCVCVGSATAGDITTGLLAWWKMDAPTDPYDANLVADSSGNGYDLVKGSDIKWENGGLAFYNQYSSGIRFSDDIGTSSLMASIMLSGVTSAMSVSFGINSGWTTEQSDRQDIFCASNSAYDNITGVTNKFLIEFPNTSGQAWIHAGANNDKMIRWTIPDPAAADYIPMFGQRAVVTITKDALAGEINPLTGLATGEIKLYVNGELTATTTHTASWDGDHDVNGTLAGMNFFRIGGRDWKWPLYGTTLDNFMIFNRALAAEDVAMLAPPVVEDHPGDANRDGKVDDLDASILAANWQRTGDATWATADFNDDGDVNDLDASILAANWQYGVGAAVPEPGSLAAVLSALLTFIAMGVRTAVGRRTIG